MVWGVGMGVVLPILSLSSSAIGVRVLNGGRCAEAVVIRPSRDEYEDLTDAIIVSLPTVLVRRTNVALQN